MPCRAPYCHSAIGYDILQYMEKITEHSRMNLEICASRYALLVLLRSEMNKAGADHKKLQEAIDGLLVLSSEELEVLGSIIKAQVE